MQQIRMQIGVYWITWVLINLSAYNYASVSVLIYIDNTSLRNCSPTTLKSLCYINVTEYDNSDVMLYTCPDLDSALEYITTTNISRYDDFSYVHICLPSGNFVLNNSWSLNISFVLTGHNGVDLSQSVIQCAGYSDTQDTNIVTNASDLEYKLFFKNVKLVKFEFVKFTSCHQPIRIEQSYNVSVLDCAFTNFSESVFDIYNSDHINIMGSNFSDNVGTGNVLLQFRGNTGAVAIGYHQSQRTNPTISVKKCMFNNNQAIVYVEPFLTSSLSVQNGTFIGRGGAIGLLVYESSYNVSAVIANSKFINNFASDYGGSIYTVISGQGTQHKISVENCQFINNTGTLGAGGIQFTIYSRGHRISPNTIIIKNCRFSQNQGGHGGAINVNLPQVESNVVAIEKNTFEKNKASDFGGAIVLAAQSLFESMEGLQKFNISDCTFKQNVCLDGIVNVVYVPLRMRGRNMFISNYGSAFQIVGCIVEIHDEVNFIKNEAQDGGALYIKSFGQLKVFPDTRIVFTRNKGRIGSSIVVATKLPSSVYSKIFNNPQCFLLYGGTPVKPFLDFTDLNFTFTDNTASEATAIYMGNAQVCSWIGNAPPHFDTASILNWPFLYTSDPNTRNTSFIETSIAQIDINKTVISWPGKITPLYIELFDETNQSASEFLQLEPVDDNKAMTRYKIKPALVYQQSNQLLVTFATENTNTDHNFSVAVRHFLDENTQSTFSINITPCLAGHKLKYDSVLGGLTCQCQDDYEYIRNCEDDQNTILLTDGHWGISQRYTMQSNNLVAYPCPSGYCRCSQNHDSLGDNLCSFAYFNSDPNKQCHCDREGYLCGDCRDGKGISALLNHCVDCSDVNSILIAALVIVDAVLITVLLCKNVMFSMLLFPTVFFVNMVSYVGENYPTSYDQVGKYMYFINSLLSLYFPYDFCLYSGATPLAMYAFRYFPLCLTIIICSAGLLWLRHKFERIREFLYNNLWLLLTLQYSHVVYTSMTILHCPKVVNENGEHESRWFVYGTLECFTGYHIPLAVCAIFVLLMCVLAIPLLGLVAVEKLTKRLPMDNMAKCLKRPYKENLPWWCVVELGRKFIFLLFLIPFPQNTFPPMFILMTLFTVYAYVLPYKEMSVNIVELFFQLSLLMFLLLRSTQSIVDNYLIFPDHEHSDDDLNGCSSETSIASLTWILFPFAYLPLVVLIGIFSMNVLIRLCYRPRQSDCHKKTEPKAAENETVSNCRNTILVEAKHTHLLDFLDSTHLALQSGTYKPPDGNKYGNDIREACFTHNETASTES